MIINRFYKTLDYKLFSRQCRLLFFMIFYQFYIKIAFLNLEVSMKSYCPFLSS